jgi:hypothetical protein
LAKIAENCDHNIDSWDPCPQFSAKKLPVFQVFAEFSSVLCQNRQFFADFLTSIPGRIARPSSPILSRLLALLQQSDPIYFFSLDCFTDSIPHKFLALIEEQKRGAKRWTFVQKGGSML